MTILMASLLLVLGVITLGLADLARVLVADARAQGAADLAALAAAQELAVPGASTPAQLADGFARANGAIVTGCVCEAGSQEAVV
ncbi:MAG: pilus assembly protein TadG-related protein, partial [Actinomycetota bacterium]